MCLLKMMHVLQSISRQLVVRVSLLLCKEIAIMLRHRHVADELPAKLYKDGRSLDARELDLDLSEYTLA